MMFPVVYLEIHYDEFIGATAPQAESSSAATAAAAHLTKIND